MPTDQTRGAFRTFLRPAIRVCLLIPLWGACGAFAGQSLVLSPGFTATATIPSRDPYKTLGSSRIEFRLHDCTAPGQAYTYILNLAGQIGVRLLPGGNLIVNDDGDKFNGATGVVLSIAGRADFSARLQRDVARKLFTLELWNADGTNYALQTLSIDTVNSTSWAGLVKIGDPQGFGGAASLAFLRWYSTLLPTGSPAPRGGSPGDLADWEFESAGADQGVNGLNLSYNSAPTYQGTPSYPPVADGGPVRTVRAGYPVVLDATNSYSFADDPGLTFAWQQMSGPTTAIWDDPTLAQATVTGLVFGTYVFRLTVTDANGQPASKDIKLGVVATDVNGVVVVGDPGVDFVLGPMMRWGLSPWPWQDITQRKDADYLASPEKLLPVPGLTPVPGAVTVTNGSNTIACDPGSGCDFGAQFSCGPNGDWIVLHYVVDGQAPHTGLRPFRAVACTPTQMTLDRNYDASAGSESGVVYGKTTDAELGFWYGSADNVNYYDVVLAHYNLYYRTGLDDYLKLARTLADRWYIQPWFDEGRAGLDPRRSAVAGLILRALDGRPEMWPNLRAYIDKLTPVWLRANDPVVFDVRDQGYIQLWNALMAAVDPDDASRQRYLNTALNFVLSFWQRTQYPDGSHRVEIQSYRIGTADVTAGSKQVIGHGTGWNTGMTDKYVQFGGDSTYYLFTAADATHATLDRPYAGPTKAGNSYVIFQYRFTQGYGAGAVTVTQGSAAVTGTNTAWVMGLNDPAGLPFQVTGDSDTYNLTVIDATHGTLDRPYAKPTKASTGYVITEHVSFSGFGDSPFMQGLLDSALVKTHLATNDPAVFDVLKKSVDNVIGAGVNPAQRGLYYARHYYECNEPNPQTSPSCAYSGATDARDLNSSVLHAIGYLYAVTGETSYLDAGDNLAGAAFGGGMGGPQATDKLFGYFNIVPATGGSGKWKDYAYAAGAGYAMAYPAYRLGGVKPPQEQSVDVDFDLSSVAGATQVRVTVTQPSGAAAQTVCSISPCSVAVDARQGAHWMQMEYLSVAGAVLSKSDPQVLQLP